MKCVHENRTVSLQFFITKYNLTYIIIGRNGLSILHPSWYEKLTSTTKDIYDNVRKMNDEKQMIDIVTLQTTINEKLNVFSTEYFLLKFGISQLVERKEINTFIDMVQVET